MLSGTRQLLQSLTVLSIKPIIKPGLVCRNSGSQITSNKFKRYLNLIVWLSNIMIKCKETEIIIINKFK